MNYTDCPNCDKKFDVTDIDFRGGYTCPFCNFSWCMSYYYSDEYLDLQNKKKYIKLNTKTVGVNTDKFNNEILDSTGGTC
jgi:hypothetical protein